LARPILGREILLVCCGDRLVYLRRSSRLCRGFGGFIALRFLLGVAEGPHFPAMSHTINRWLPPAERARAFSLGLVAIPLSSVVGAPLTSYLVSDFGWRHMFFIISGIGIVWAIVWYFLFRDHPEDSPLMSNKEKKLLSDTCGGSQKNKKHSVDWHFILTHPTLIANNIAYFAFAICSFSQRYGCRDILSSA